MGSAAAGMRDVPRGARTSNGSRARRQKLVLRLYVAGNAPNSAAAMTNLRALLPEGETSSDSVVLEVVDVLREPARALDEGITASPTLVRLSPLPVVHIVGSLSDRETVRAALGLSK